MLILPFVSRKILELCLAEWNRKKIPSEDSPTEGLLSKIYNLAP